MLSLGLYRLSVDGFRFLISINNAAVTFLEHTSLYAFESLIVGEFLDVKLPGHRVHAVRIFVAVAKFLTKRLPQVHFHPCHISSSFYIFKNLLKSL